MIRKSIVKPIRKIDIKERDICGKKFPDEIFTGFSIHGDWAIPIIIGHMEFRVNWNDFGSGVILQCCFFVYNCSLEFILDKWLFPRSFPIWKFHTVFEVFVDVTMNPFAMIYIMYMWPALVEINLPGGTGIDATLHQRFGGIVIIHGEKNIGIIRDAISARE